MPQKKNPLILEKVKSYSSETIGTMVSTFSSMKGVSYTNTLDRVVLKPVIIYTAVGSTNVMEGVVETIKPIQDNMMQKLKPVSPP